jgi:hypothetical protein
MFKNRRITFTPSSEKADLLNDAPKPAYSHVPSWYKTQKLFSNDENNYLKAFKKGNLFKTYKMCTPLVDSITSGYMITLPADIIVTNVGVEEYVPQINWSVSWEVLDFQADEVLGNYPVPTGFYKSVFRWNPEWIVETPAGYSLWVTHPAHRHDLPFFTLNSFIDTDKHPNQIFFPFFIKSGFEGIIQKGTPIVQIIPVRRESWVTRVRGFNKNNSIVRPDNMNLVFTKAYKHNYWSKKKYE